MKGKKKKKGSYVWTREKKEKGVLLQESPVIHPLKTQISFPKLSLNQGNERREIFYKDPNLQTSTTVKVHLYKALSIVFCNCWQGSEVMVISLMGDIITVSLYAMDLPATSVMACILHTRTKRSHLFPITQLVCLMWE